MSTSYKPPGWDKPRLVSELTKRHIPFKIDGDKVLVPECGSFWLGSTWW